MIDERFSKHAFDTAGWNSEESRVLCGQLDAEIHALLLKQLRPAVREIVEKLNSMGHALVDVGQEFGDDIHYREPVGTNRMEEFRMLLAADLIITIGYPKTARNPEWLT